MTLLRLTLENVGLIRHAEIDFASGLTVLTGETGSGKTMLIDGLGLTLGGRADAEIVSNGADRARATLEIAPDAAMRTRFAEAGFPLADDDDAIVVREVLAGGRSQGRINGAPAAASQLRELVGSAVDVVSQHQAQRLLAPAFALAVLDRFGGTETLDAAGDVRAAHAALREARERLTAVRDDGGRAAARAEFARFARDEIDGAGPFADDEDETLRARRDVLSNAERITAALAAAAAALEDERGAVDALGDAESALLGIAKYAEGFGELAAAVAALQSEANELAVRMARERERIELDPGELDRISARLDAFDRLKKKYGGTLAAVRAQRDAFAADVADIDDRDAQIAAAERETSERDAALRRAAERLSAGRAASAARIEAALVAELAALEMPAARLRFALEPLDEPGAAGAERAELRFAANPGEPERALGKIASGGELSRVLLALVVVLADRRERTALVFDEIDAGIGGATASAVGVRLARLARSAQVVCVTHLAQIASHGEGHVALRKRTDGETTTIETVALAAGDRRAEVARMLSGEQGGVALEHAGALLRGAADLRTR